MLAARSVQAKSNIFFLIAAAKQTIVVAKQTTVAAKQTAFAAKQTIVAAKQTEFAAKHCFYSCNHPKLWWTFGNTDHFLNISTILNLKALDTHFEMAPKSICLAGFLFLL